MSYFDCETEYLKKELSVCLIDILTKLVEIRPRDPIEYVALSLKQFRTLHPFVNQGKQQCDLTSATENAHIISHFQSSLPTESYPTRFTSVLLQRNFKSCTTTTLDIESESSALESSSLECSDIFVHKEFLSHTILEDLFDDEDLS
ncbi:hypothetical protein Bpfe_024824 [Biomphalaria pfeifferi]|uniref:Uncharacterized protein n=1 Tax=Biomphalaria pfeifferi TaxID=112525 RepID=A0AAD8B0A3_BIOPF|nr:hypothetical protein Bpfe_024824 [Biomphalaria pfeifferi]